MHWMLYKLYFDDNMVQSCEHTKTNGYFQQNIILFTSKSNVTWQSMHILSKFDSNTMRITELNANCQFQFISRSSYNGLEN